MKPRRLILLIALICATVDGPARSQEVRLAPTAIQLQKMWSREAGAEIRVNSRVSRVLVRDGRAGAVVLEDGSEITTTAVISNADPRHTLLALIDPLDLDPVFLSRMRNYR